MIGSFSNVVADDDGSNWTFPIVQRPELCAPTEKTTSIPVVAVLGTATGVVNFVSVDETANDPLAISVRVGLAKVPNESVEFAK